MVSKLTLANEALQPSSARGAGGTRLRPVQRLEIPIVLWVSWRPHWFSDTDPKALEVFLQRQREMTPGVWIAKR